ncbi:pentapeptide repeat-containing protein [Nostoc sp. UHCC 0702]|nr:pentapeptide repeat-containing protein [Nostoc sp. UHCC 0702]
MTTKSSKKLPLSPSTKKSWCQILTTLLITFSIIGGIALLENEQKKDKCKYNMNICKIIRLTSNFKLSEQLQNIGVLSAAILFFWDTFDRKKQLERQAWQLIDGAQGSETSGARKQAIEDLYKERADITGLDADGADLRGINLSGADLTGASFKNAILEEANFERAILTEANFEGANLQGANLRGAILIDAYLTGADLRTKRDKNDETKDIATKLQGANLRSAKLNSAKLRRTEFGKFDGNNTDLSSAYFRKANIADVEFKNVNIDQAFFGGAKTGNDELDINIIQQANNYEKAYYSKSFVDKHPTQKLQLDDKYKEPPELDISLLNNKDNIASLSVIELLNLLKYIHIEYTENKNENFDDNFINTIISLENRLKRLDSWGNSAKQKASSTEKILDDADKEYREITERWQQIDSKYEDTDTE